MIEHDLEAAAAGSPAAWLCCVALLLPLSSGCTGDDDGSMTVGDPAQTGGSNTSTSSEPGSGSEDPSASSQGSGSDPTGAEASGSGSTSTDSGDATGSSTNGSTSAGSEGGETTGATVYDCTECDEGEVCLLRIGFAEKLECVPIPEACEGDVDCECGASLCVDPYFQSIDPPRPGWLECECPNC